MTLKDVALKIRPMAYAPYSGFKVGAAIRRKSGKTYSGVNVENIAYPEGTCAEAGAIAAMVASGETEITEAYVVADSPSPVPPCGGCRQKLSEFAGPNALITLATTDGQENTYKMSELLPGVFTLKHMNRVK